MPTYETERDLLNAVRERLDGWLYRARADAFAELFEDEDALLSADELRVLDRIDSELSRERGRGVWDTDEYGIVSTGTMSGETPPRVVCTTHPRLPEQGHPGDERLDEETRRKLNDALWQYSQRVVERTQQELEEFVWSVDVEAWETQ
ncbi:DUF7539 family protein [Natrialbaceae archaeon AArc-T1-2]|uniref:DUF7539 family protein n=1 Tax=Natrialbaceae archaeon AArc-T1-2 TaxID=3053904 RepID=UPI00255ACB09|nr:hypothetical protein [Natrialbaceae archaeon AArc-T1-2]WIV66720.1 hypothetical protein QQ977_13615 [Natrialbaceae archaeon AArc-T1-2]